MVEHKLWHAQLLTLPMNINKVQQVLGELKAKLDKKI